MSAFTAREYQFKNLEGLTLKGQRLVNLEGRGKDGWLEKIMPIGAFFARGRTWREARKRC